MEKNFDKLKIFDSNPGNSSFDNKKKSTLEICFGTTRLDSNLFQKKRVLLCQ